MLQCEEKCGNNGSIPNSFLEAIVSCSLTCPCMAANDKRVRFKLKFVFLCRIKKTSTTLGAQVTADWRLRLGDQDPQFKGSTRGRPNSTLKQQHPPFCFFVEGARKICFGSHAGICH